MMKQWKEKGVEAFANDLLVANLRKFPAYGVFAFLIALV